MREKLFMLSAVLVITFLVVSGVVYAETISTNVLKSNEVDGDVGRFDSIHIGKQDVGGVTFFNGTIVNSTTAFGEDLPVTFGDDVRIDGAIYRGHNRPEDQWPVKIADHLVPTIDNNYDLGEKDRRWRDLYLSGGIQLGASELTQAGTVR